MIHMTQKCSKNVANFSYSNYGLTFLRFLSLTLLLWKMAFLLVNQNNRKIKNDNNVPERIAIKKNSVVNSESKKYKYIIYLLNEYVLPHYGCDDCDHELSLIHASLRAL